MLICKENWDEGSGRRERIKGLKCRWQGLPGEKWDKGSWKGQSGNSCVCTGGAGGGRHWGTRELVGSRQLGNRIDPLLEEEAWSWCSGYSKDSNSLHGGESWGGPGMCPWRAQFWEVWWGMWESGAWGGQESPSEEGTRTAQRLQPSTESPVLAGWGREMQKSFSRPLRNLECRLRPRKGAFVAWQTSGCLRLLFCISWCCAPERVRTWSSEADCSSN